MVFLRVSRGRPSFGSRVRHRGTLSDKETRLNFTCTRSSESFHIRPNYSHTAMNTSSHNKMLCFTIGALAKPVLRGPVNRFMSEQRSSYRNEHKFAQQNAALHHWGTCCTRVLEQTQAPRESSHKLSLLTITTPIQPQYSQDCLGLCYEGGQGVTQDYQEARRLLSLIHI